MLWELTGLAVGSMPDTLEIAQNSWGGPEQGAESPVFAEGGMRRLMNTGLLVERGHMTERVGLGPNPATKWT